MRRFVTFCLALSFTVTIGLAATRPPAVAGSFYPADKTELAFQINKFLSKVPGEPVTGELVALIVPHAGYQFSGQVAAYGYQQLVGRSFDRVILIGASHKFSFDQIALPGCDEFATPLGNVPVDRDFIANLTKLNSRFVVDDEPHLAEHSLEVQLPFLQATLGQFKIVPLLFGNISLANCQALAYALSYLVDDRTLIVVSTDWSHYHPSDLAKRLDDKGIKDVVAGSLEAFIRDLADGNCEACAAPGVITALLLTPALGANRTELLKQANSGDTTGDVSRVVGYAAIAFQRVAVPLTVGERQKLLKIARRTVENKLAGKKLPVFTPPEPALNEPRGVFVSLKKEGELRGCIGYIAAARPLFQAVQEMVVAAATEDRRFSPVTKSELPALAIEISVLSRLVKIKDVQEIEIGRDGLYIMKDQASGLLLPQVAVEWGWDRAEFLKQVCLKAGLPAEAWPEADLYRFTADVFHETTAR
ncbi:MAG: AmmeMemoRadiSam system protein B [Candidatus Margulisiibacteriota bacterium]